MIEAGKVLQNRYRVEKQIGQGGMGVVFIATDERFGSTVAIKETFFTDDKLRKAFEREARLLNSLRHPALPRVSDHFVEGNGQFLVMEYIDGEDLGEQVEAGESKFAVADIIKWADQLLDALEYLHTQEMPVIHRDIKPQNLKLNSRGQIILLDFGLAKGNPTSPESATAAKSIVGYSRNYASIEQIQGSGTDPRSDLYSLAATLYHLLTGEPPVDALTRAMSVLSGKPDPLIDASQLRPDTPPGFSRILSNAMALGTEERPPTAKAMRELLANHENFTAPNIAAMNTGVSPATNIYSQKTQIHQETVADAPVIQNDVKTVAFENQDSKVTQLKPDSTTGDLAYGISPARSLAGVTENKTRRGFAVGAALGALILAGTATAAFFVYPEMFGKGTTTPSNVNARTPAVAEEPSPAPSVASVTGENTNANSALTTATPAVTPTTSVDSKTKETAARTDNKEPETKTPEQTKPDTRAESPVTTVTQPDRPEKVPPPIDDDRPPSGNPNQRPIPPEVWQKMTPRQRRQLRQALELQRQRQEQQRDQPRPQPPPPNN